MPLSPALSPLLPRGEREAKCSLLAIACSGAVRGLKCITQKQKNATRERVALRLSPAMSARKRSFGRRGLLEDQFVAFHRDLNGIVVVQMAFENLLGQRVFEITLDRAAHRARAINRVVAFLHQKIFRLLV